MVSVLPRGKAAPESQSSKWLWSVSPRWPLVHVPDVCGPRSHSEAQAPTSVPCELDTGRGQQAEVISLYQDELCAAGRRLSASIVPTLSRPNLLFLSVMPGLFPPTADPGVPGLPLTILLFAWVLCPFYLNEL